MPMDKSRYPPDWKQISLRIRERDGWHCKWCGVKNGAIGARDKYGAWHDEDAIWSLNSTDGYDLFGEYPKIIRIVLTVAHLGVAYPDGRDGNKHDKRDCRDENLAALCQRCHLNYDRDEHIENRRKTHARKRVQNILNTGQMVLEV